MEDNAALMRAAGKGAWRGAVAAALLTAVISKIYELITAAPGSGIEKGWLGVFYAFLAALLFSFLFAHGPMGALVGAVMGATRAAAQAGHRRAAVGVCLAGSGLYALAAWQQWHRTMQSVADGSLHPKYGGTALLGLFTGTGLWSAALLVWAVMLWRQRPPPEGTAPDSTAPESAASSPVDKQATSPRGFLAGWDAGAWRGALAMLGYAVLLTVWRKGTQLSESADTALQNDVWGFIASAFSDIFFMSLLGAPIGALIGGVLGIAAALLRRRRRKAE